jgi:hypothetical protein
MKRGLRTLLLIFILLLLLNNSGVAQDRSGKLIVADVCLSPTELNLASMINEYRKEKKLPDISLSRSLTFVAQVHARDLAQYHRQNKRCNMHSWSDNGPWTSCCYKADQHKASCMWNKPRELTDYKGDGFEIAFYSTFPYSSPYAFATDILKGWQKSKGHNQVIINGGVWKDIEWTAMGVGVYGEYAVVWFGRVPDEAPIPGMCIE